MTDIELIAGLDNSQSDPQRLACRERLAPVIHDLLTEGMRPAAIVATLAELTVTTIGHHRRNH